MVQIMCGTRQFFLGQRHGPCLLVAVMCVSLCVGVKMISNSGMKFQWFESCVVLVSSFKMASGSCHTAAGNRCDVEGK